MFFSSAWQQAPSINKILKLNINDVLFMAAATHIPSIKLQQWEGRVRWISNDELSYKIDIVTSKLAIKWVVTEVVGLSILKKTYS